MRTWLSVALILFFATGASVAASISTFDFGSTGEAADKAVLIEGELAYPDIAAFEDFTSHLSRQTVVFISSPGGNLKAGIEIGRSIHRRGFRTAVADICASACALAWLAGSQRFASERAQIGFHVAYLDGVKRVESGMGNAIVGLYLGELGFRENVVTYITSASPDDMQWLSFRDAALLGIDVQVVETGPPAQQPVLATPAPPVISQPTEAAAVALVRNLIESDMSRGRDALTIVRNTYADWLNYYGKRSSFAGPRGDTRSAKIRFARRATPGCAW
jgi:hypothetical protein